MLKFNWTPGDVAWSLVAVGALTAVSFGVLPRLVVPRVGEPRAVYLGLFFAALGYAGYAFAPSPFALYAWMVVWALGGIGGPALNAIMLKAVPANEQGELMGARQPGQHHLHRRAADDDRPLQVLHQRPRLHLFRRRVVPRRRPVRVRWPRAVRLDAAAHRAGAGDAIARRRFTPVDQVGRGFESSERSTEDGAIRLLFGAFLF
jgi:hypothetical protein